MKKMDKPRFQVGDLVRVKPNKDNTPKTEVYIGMVGLVKETSYIPRVEFGNEIITCSEDELSKVKLERMKKK